jgi:hypothetical protein
MRQPPSRKHDVTHEENGPFCSEIDSLEVWLAYNTLPCVSGAEMLMLLQNRKHDDNCARRMFAFSLRNWLIWSLSYPEMTNPSMEHSSEYKKMSMTTWFTHSYNTSHCVSGTEMPLPQKRNNDRHGSENHRFFVPTLIHLKFLPSDNDQSKYITLHPVSKIYQWQCGSYYYNRSLCVFNAEMLQPPKPKHDDNARGECLPLCYEPIHLKSVISENDQSKYITSALMSIISMTTWFTHSYNTSPCVSGTEMLPPEKRSHDVMGSQNHHFSVPTSVHPKSRISGND